MLTARTSFAFDHTGRKPIRSAYFYEPAWQLSKQHWKIVAFLENFKNLKQDGGPLLEPITAPLSTKTHYFLVTLSL